jgi:quercetin dioxygenase-like cupin family protein
MPDIVSTIYVDNIKDQAVFSTEEPKPQFLVDTSAFKALVVGLEAGQQVPLHPAELAMYYFLEGEGLMTVGDETYAVRPGVMLIALDGAPRGINAKTRLIFLGSKGA